MVAYQKATVADIVEDARKNKRVDFLKELATTQGLKDKEGNPRAITFIELKRKYYKEFYKELIPVAKNPKKDKTFLDLIKEL